MAQIDITDVNSALGTYHRKHSTKLHAQLMLKPESFDFMTAVPGIKDERTSIGIEVSEVTQAYQAAFVPKQEDEAFPITGKVHPWMIDLEYNNFDDLEATYMGWVLEEQALAQGKPTDTTLGRFLWERMMEKALEERELYAGTGKRVAPTPGTEGDASDAWDGFLTIIEELVTASAPLNIVPTGPLSNVAGMHAKLEGFVKGIHPQFRKVAPQIFCSYHVSQGAMQDFRSQYPYMVEQGDGLKSPAFLDSNIKLRGLTSFATSHRLLYTPKSNFKYMFDMINNPSTFQVVPDIDKLKIRLKGKLGFMFDDARKVWINDQT